MIERIVVNMPDDRVCFVEGNAMYVDRSGTIWVNGDYDYLPSTNATKDNYYPVLRDGEEVIMDINMKPDEFREMDVLDTRSIKFRVKWIDGLVG